MGKFKHHDPCPRCGSRDNLAVWDDGSFCFGCGLTLPKYRGMSLEDIKKQISYDENKEKKSRVVSLPDDFTLSLPQIALDWLGKYGITEQERLKYQIGWTEHGWNPDSAPRQCLVFVARDAWANLLLAQFRYMGPETATNPKYYTRGFPESVLWTVQPSSDAMGTLCVVEDYVSCLRVGRSIACTPLWGSSLSAGQIARISDHYERLVIWLDFDKAGKGSELRVKALPYFKSVNQIVTEKDPKEYSDEHIRAHLGVVP